MLAKKKVTPYHHGRQVLADNIRARMIARYPMVSTENARIGRLAAASGVSRATIQRILKCSHATTVDMIEDLARGLRCETHELLIESPSEE